MNISESKCAMDKWWRQLRRISAGRAGHGVRLPLGLALLLVLCLGRALAQSSSEHTDTGQLSNTNPMRLEREHSTPGLDGDAGDSAFQQRRMRQLSAALHKSIVSDTDKLLKLVTELNAEIASTNPSSLTPEQVRTVAAIEKLARNVKNQMRNPIQGMPSSFEPAKPLENNPNHR